MKLHSLTQGTQEWHAHRAQFNNASDAPAMMGCSPYKTRAELLRERATGLTREVDAATQRRFDDGHRVEALARPLAEKIIGDELYPCTGTEGDLSASFDGLTLMADVAWEHKSLGAALRDVLHADIKGFELPLHYRVQMEQQCIVSGCEKVLFMASKWDGDTLVEERHCWYLPDPALRAQILAGWAQFKADLAAYVPPAADAPAAVAAPVEALPAVSVRMNGSIAVISNLDLFGAKLREFVGRIDMKPSSDQAFADAEAAVKALQKAEDALAAAESAALAETASIEEMRRSVATYIDLSRSTRLALKKVVEQRKEQIKTEIVQEGQQALAKHVDELNARLGRRCMPHIPADFGAAIKGKKTVAGLRDAMTTALLNAKLEANAIADRIDVNLKHLAGLPPEHAALFPDANTIALKQVDDFRALVESRVAEFQRREAARIEADRERIRREEAARLERERAEQESAQQAATRPSAPPPAYRTAEPELYGDDITVVEAVRGADALTVMDPQSGTVRKPADAIEIDGAHCLSVGAIGKRLGFPITAAFIAEDLGKPHHTKAGAATYWLASDFAGICDALMARVQDAKGRRY